MRLAPSSGAHASLVSEHWGRWFGPVSRDAFNSLQWENGFVVRASLRSPPAVPLFTLRSLCFVRELSISLPIAAPLTGLELLPRLRHLRVALPWGHSLVELGPAFERVSSLELVLHGFAGSGELGILHARLPKLRRLIIDAAQLPQQTVGNLTAAPWLSQLEALTLCDIGNENAGPLLNRSQVFEHLGDRLHLDLQRDAIQRDALRKKFPRARLRFSDVSAYRADFADRGRWAVQVPVLAPKNYASLPSSFVQLSEAGAYGGPGGTFASSGAPFADKTEHRFCAQCASDRTLGIYAQAQLDDDVRFGSRTWWLCEWRCTECGWLTSSVRPPQMTMG
ncbi:MAG: hypothetical protein JNM17_30330 [Archangium sp.]|nr:hypothetical protein [Archangium sp.]